MIGSSEKKTRGTTIIAPPDGQTGVSVFFFFLVFSGKKLEEMETNNLPGVILDT